MRLQNFLINEMSSDQINTIARNIDKYPWSCIAEVESTPDLAHNIYPKFNQRWFYAMTLNQNCFTVESMLFAQWYIPFVPYARSKVLWLSPSGCFFFYCLVSYSPLLEICKVFCPESMTHLKQVGC